MFYKPNYCCNCGEQIERVDWRLWTSRRFCEVCETEYQLDDWLKRIVPALFLLFGLFGIGSYFQETENSLNVQNNNKGLTIKSLKTTSDKIDSKSNSKNEKSNLQVVNGENKLGDKHTEKINENVFPVNQNNSPIEKKEQKVVIAKSPQKSANNTVYFCGAATKKGTPCSRRVKGGGRCWQHKGREAILSRNELLAESNQ